MKFNLLSRSKSNRSQPRNRKRQPRRIEQLEPRLLLANVLSSVPAAWMRGLPDQTPLTEVTIPGTHNTMTDSYPRISPLSLGVVTQGTTLTEQLNQGIRFLDIRIHHKHDQLALVHGEAFLVDFFVSVLRDTTRFLNQNPSETVLMRIKSNEVPQSNNTASFEQAFRSNLGFLDPQTQKYFGEFVWCGAVTDPINLPHCRADNTPSLATRFTRPTLGDVRGKIVIFAQGSDEFLQTSPEWSAPFGFLKYNDFIAQDEFTELDERKKFDFFKAHDARTEAGSNQNFYINFLSANSKGFFDTLKRGVFFQNATPLDLANDVNPEAVNYFERTQESRTRGIVMMDFAGERLQYQNIFPPEKRDRKDFNGNHQDTSRLVGLIIDENMSKLRIASSRNLVRIAEDGGSFASGNIAREGTAFALNVIAGGSNANHQIAHLNDGQYGNSSNWIGVPGGLSFAGIAWGSTRRIDSIAFGRDNTGQFKDRVNGVQTLQYTNVANPGEADWNTIGSLTYSEGVFTSPGSGIFVTPPSPRNPSLRHRYFFEPVDARAIRIITSDERAIDEIEVYSPFTLTLNTPPTITPIADQSVAPNTSTAAIAFTIGDSQTAAESLFVSAVSSNASLFGTQIQLDGTGANRTLTVIPGATQAASETITVTVVDEAGLSASQSFQLTVIDPNTAPTITPIDDRLGLVDTPVTGITFSIADQQTAASALTITATSSNPALAPNENIQFTGLDSDLTLSVTPLAGQTGLTTISVNVTDAGGLTTTQTFEVSFIGANTPPTISDSTDQSIVVNGSAFAIITIGDEQTLSDELQVTVTSSDETLLHPDGISVSVFGEARAITFFPVDDKVGTTTVTITVTDGFGASASDEFVLTVTADNSPPTISNIDDQTVIENQSTDPISFMVGDEESEPGALVVTAFSLNPDLIPNANIIFGGSGANRTLTLTPVEGQSGTTTIMITVTDEGGLEASNEFVLTVDTDEAAPTIVPIPNQSTVVNTAASVTITIGDADSEASGLDYFAISSNQELVPNENITYGGTGATRTITMAPISGQTGTTTITVAVTDQTDLTTTATFELTVTEMASPATVSVSVAPASVTEDGAGELVYTFTRIGSTAAALPVSYTVSGTATSGDDFTALPGTVTIPAGQNSVTVSVNPTDDTTTEPNESIIVIVTDTADYDIGPSTAITGTITNDDGVITGPVVNISPMGPNGAADPTDLESGKQPTSWAKQRSSLRQIVIDLPASITAATAADVVLTNLGVNVDVDPDVVITLTNDQITLNTEKTQLTISLAADQLSDGVYQLELKSGITNGGPFTIVGNATNKFYVLKADWNGSGGVTIQDFATFAYWFGSIRPNAPDYVDGNNSGAVNIQDFSPLAANFGKSIVFPGAMAQGESNGNGGQGELVAAMRTLVNPPDVNGDGHVTAGDALNVINELSLGSSVVDGWSPRDVNRDRNITAADALRVINQLLSKSSGVNASGESVLTDILLKRHDDLVVTRPMADVSEIDKSLRGVWPVQRHPQLAADVLAEEIVAKVVIESPSVDDPFSEESFLDELTVAMPYIRSAYWVC